MPPVPQLVHRLIGTHVVRFNLHTATRANDGRRLHHRNYFLGDLIFAAQASAATRLGQWCGDVNLRSGELLYSLLGPSVIIGLARDALRTLALALFIVPLYAPSRCTGADTNCQITRRVTLTVPHFAAACSRF